MGTVKSKRRYHNVGDLMRDLGVRASRIRMTPLPGLASEQDLLAFNERKNGLFELVDGVLVEKPVGFREGLLAAYFIELIGPFVRTGALGLVTAPDSPLRLGNGLVRLPDVAFVSWDQLPDFTVPEDAIPSLYPDLAIEVYSKSNTRKEMARKRREYFRAGSRLVWIVFPKTKTIDVYTSPTEFETLGIGDMLDGGEVLPGFTVAVRDIFAPPPPPKPTKARNGKKK